MTLYHGLHGNEIPLVEVDYENLFAVGRVLSVFSSIFER